MASLHDECSVPLDVDDEKQSSYIFGIVVISAALITATLVAYVWMDTVRMRKKEKHKDNRLAFMQPPSLKKRISGDKEKHRHGYCH